MRGAAARDLPGGKRKAQGAAGAYVLWYGFSRMENIVRARFYDFCLRGQSPISQYWICGGYGLRRLGRQLGVESEG